MNSTVIKKFITKLNTNSPLLSSTKNIDNNFYEKSIFSKYKYPYKPILLIALVKNISTQNLFNHPIKITIDSPIVKTYYDLLTNSTIMYEFLNKQKSKSNWFLIYNDLVKQQIVDNIFEMPAIKLITENFWTANKKTQTITINYNGDNQSLEQLKLFLLNEAINCLWKCIPEYKNLNINELSDLDHFYQQKLIDGSAFNDNVQTYQQYTRTYQHIFRKIIFNRDQKCLICCTDIPELLEAAHIKPYASCKNQLEKYDTHNGMLLCRNHHRLFDEGFFTLNNNATISISKQLKKADADLLIKTFEPCYKNINHHLSFYQSKEYIAFHQKYIFKQ